MGRRTLLVLTAGVALAAPAPALGQLPLGLPDVLKPAARDTEPVVLSGAELTGWAVSSETTLRLPLWDLVEDAQGADPHSHYATPQLDTSSLTGGGTQIARFLGLRWDAAQKRFAQIPLQVDERFTRYLNNTASGFAIYSGEDRHTTYAYDGPGDREGFRFRLDGPAEDPCRARPASAAAHDPVPGLDADDEVAFMASDAGPKAPAGTPRPAGIDGLREIELRDPLNPLAAPRYAYVARATPTGPRPAFDATNGHVRYQRDANADLFAYSQSSYGNYGNAPKGLYCDAEGRVVRNEDGTPKLGQRRPRDGATVTTSRYRYRYDGRWLMTAIQVSPDGGQTYGPDLVDRWKARAFAQDPASETPCCGYEEEDNNWGGSSILLGERAGPVRAIRETWGADSGTNVIRRETFYRDEVAQRTFLRVHPVPPLDGIYAQWDFNAGAVDRFYSAARPAGVAVDGRNDEVYGNFDDPCNTRWDGNDTSAADQGYRTLYDALGLCALPYHLSADAPDLTFSSANAALGWSVTSGPDGSIVDRLGLAPLDATAGGTAQGMLAVPYYRDDSCFDDGTGTDPGPKVRPRSGDEPATYGDPPQPRRCWTPADGRPDGSERFFQGSIATHGTHLLAVADSDNLRQTVPLTEIVADWRMVMLPGRRDASDGEAYGRRQEKPLVAVVRDPGLLAPVPLGLALPGLR